MMELKLGSIPVRVQGWFIMMALLLGSNERNPARLATWVAVVIVSVVIHELGHALMGKAFGLVPSIELHGMGGTTSFERDPSIPARDLGMLRSVAISVAGPFAGFLFALVVMIAQSVGLQPTNPIGQHAVRLLFAVNIGWGIFNLVPMLPLDGGNVLRHVLVAVSKQKGETIARIISIVIAVAIALLALTRDQWWILYLGGLFAFRNVQAIRQEGQQRVDRTLAEAVERSYDAAGRHAWKEAIGLLRPALVPTASIELRQAALPVFVVALIRDGASTEALDVLARERALVNEEDLAQYAGVLREVGRNEEAERVLRLAAPA